VVHGGPNPPGVSVHTSLRIDDAEEQIALVVLPMETIRAGEDPMEISLDEDWKRKSEASSTETRMHEIDGVEQPWTLLQCEGGWAATRHHEELTLTVVGRGVDFDEVRLERVADPPALDRPRWTGKPAGVIALGTELKRID
jgi:hypothetical protein